MTDKFGRATSNTSTSASNVTRSYIRANYIESNLEEDIDMKNQFKILNLPNPTLLQDPATKYYVDNKTVDLVPNSEFDNTTIVRTNKNNNFNGNTITGCESVYVNRDPQYDLELSTKQYTDTLIDESSIVRNNKDIIFSKSISLNTDPTKQFDDYEIDNILPKSVITEFITTSIDEFSLLRLHQDEKLDHSDYITLESNLTVPKTILYIPLNNNLARTDRDNDFNNHIITNVGDPINDSDAVNKRYVDSGLKQDGIVSDTSDIVPIVINTTNGELSFQLATKQYVDKFMYDEFQTILVFTNNTGTNLWLDWVLEVAAGMSSLAGFFKSSNTGTSSTGTGPDLDGLPPIGDYYAYIEASNPNNGSDKYASITYTKHENITKINFWYHRKGTSMCQFRIQYRTLDDKWIDQFTFPRLEQSDGWEFLEETILEDNKGIRFYFDEILSFESDMAFSNITVYYHSPK